MITIRHYKKEEYKKILMWWIESGNIPATPDMMPEESTFIASIDGEDAVCVTLYLTNSKELSYIENLIGNPSMKSKSRKKATAHLIQYAEKFARMIGYKKLICLTNKDKLKEYYNTLGYMPTLNNVTTFVKEL